MNRPFTSTHLMWPCYTGRLPSHNLIYTVDYSVIYTFSYYSKKFICVCSHSSVHAHGTKFRVGNFKHSKISAGRAR